MCYNTAALCQHFTLGALHAPGEALVKIAKVETFRVLDRFLLIEITTDNGLVGLGEAGMWSYPDAAEAVVNHFATYLVGQDPLRIEHHAQYLYRNAHFQGASIAGALGAVDIALWDIKGQHYGAPIWDLLGGRCRDRVRCFYGLRDETPEGLAASAKKAADEGFTCLRVFPTPPGFEKLTFVELMAACKARVGAVRDAVGNHVDIGLELHRRLDAAQALGLAQEVAGMRIAFIEDPLLPDHIQSLARLAHQMPAPLAAGERLQTIYSFRELLETDVCRYIRPDVCLAGGFTQTKKIAAMAEAYQVGLIPHHPLSPVCSAANVQFEAAVPNVIIHEYTDDDTPERRLILQENIVVKDGYCVISETPGLGVKLNHAGIAQLPRGLRPLQTGLRYDGSVADR
jgi:galactonate dehydratase